MTEQVGTKKTKAAVILGWVGNRDGGSGQWVIENPTDQQIQVFKDAGFPYLEKANFADVDLMKKAGATFHSPAKSSPAVLAFIDSTIDETRLPSIVFGFRKGLGPTGYIIRNPSEEKIDVFRSACYNFRKWALCADSDLLAKAQAEYCPDMNDVPEFVAIILGGSKSATRTDQSELSRIKQMVRDDECRAAEGMGTGS